MFKRIEYYTLSISNPYAGRWAFYSFKQNTLDELKSGIMRSVNREAARGKREEKSVNPGQHKYQKTELHLY